MKADDLVKHIRRESGLSLRALAAASDLAASTLHRIEHGHIHPTLRTLERIASTAGMSLHVEPHVDYAASVVGLAASIRESVRQGDVRSVVRRAAELTHRFRTTADPDRRRRMIAAEPSTTTDPRWDAFVAGLAEWLAVTGELDTPAWTQGADRYLSNCWWVSPMKSLHAWEYAGTPMAFKSRGVYVHRDSLDNV